MAAINDFTDFEAFKKSREFVRMTGKVVRSGKFNRDPDLVRQIRRASVSVLSNFAEGFDREGTQEFVQYLTYSKGSIGEMRGQLIYAVDEEMLEEQKRVELDQVARRATRLIGGLITYLNSGKHRGRKYTRFENDANSRTPQNESPSHRTPGQEKRRTVDGRRSTVDR
jgi:four helix bundle protein